MKCIAESQYTQCQESEKSEKNGGRELCNFELMKKQRKISNSKGNGNVPIIYRIQCWGNLHAIAKSLVKLVARNRDGLYRWHSHLMYRRLLGKN